MIYCFLQTHHFLALFTSFSLKANLFFLSKKGFNETTYLDGFLLFFIIQTRVPDFWVLHSFENRWALIITNFLCIGSVCFNVFSLSARKKNLTRFQFVCWIAEYASIGPPAQASNTNISFARKYFCYNFVLCTYNVYVIRTSFILSTSNQRFTNSVSKL